jgi:DNA-binding NarL/FixJ family response regulator
VLIQTKDVLYGLDIGRQVKEMLPAIKLVYLTMNPDTDVAGEAYRRGALGYLLSSQRSLRRVRLQLGAAC